MMSRMDRSKFRLALCSGEPRGKGICLPHPTYRALVKREGAEE